MSLRVLAAALLAALLAALGSCVTPSVPVPPPSPEAMSFALEEVSCAPGPDDPECDATSSTRSVATFSAIAISGWQGAWVVIRNQRNGRGVVGLAEADGSVAGLTFDAQDGDDVLIGYESVDGITAGLCLTVHDGASSSAFRCD